MGSGEDGWPQTTNEGSWTSRRHALMILQIDGRNMTPEHQLSRNSSFYCRCLRAEIECWSRLRAGHWNKPGIPRRRAFDAPVSQLWELRCWLSWESKRSQDLPQPQCRHWKEAPLFPARHSELSSAICWPQLGLPSSYCSCPLHPLWPWRTPFDTVLAAAGTASPLPLLSLWNIN